MLVMNESGARKLLSSKFTLGGEGEVVAGPVGRTASAGTDAFMHAEILSWSRSRGVFAGISLQGATLRQDLDDNEALYGKRIENRELVTRHVTRGQHPAPFASGSGPVRESAAAPRCKIVAMSDVDSDAQKREEFNIPLPPASFGFIVLSLRAQAEMQLGLMPVDEEEKPEIDLQMARHTIDMMGVLLEKTKGNLTLDEQRLLENSLTELRFRFVQVSDEIAKTATPKA